MFDSLSDKITQAFKKLTGKGTINESSLNDALREIRIAFLEADVALSATKTFIESIKSKALGKTVLNSVSPGQMVIKIVNDELIKFLGSDNYEINLKSKPPVVILMAGLQGSGKTTTSAKLANRLINKQKKTVLMASLDIYRPAAQEQLQTLGKQNKIETLEIIKNQSPLEIALRAKDKAEKENFDILILDSAGRNHIDKKMMDEIVNVSKKVSISQILLVVDSMAGQDAANIAKSFSQKLDLSGIILTRVDGDSRGGAALSMKTITDKPILYMGVGEKIEEFEEFHPDRIASRILGMGDVVSLVEKASEEIDEKEAETLQKKLIRGKFTLTDYAKQLDQITKMGGIQSLLKYLPGMDKLKNNVDSSIDKSKLIESQKAMISSMTKKEKNFPDIIKASRKIRIAKGSGTTVQELNKLLKQFKKMSQMMKKFGKNKNMESIMNSSQFKNFNTLMK
jgi:signal recognition particle subunit SRP54